jgi:hypothetical protein
MRIPGWRPFGWVLLGLALTVTSLVTDARPARAIEVGEPAPGFTLPSTAGGDISLSDFRGKKFVFLEFYGADFAPT